MAAVLPADGNQDFFQKKYLSIMTQLLSEYHLFGLTAGLFTFLIIGLFHPLVIKGYYYFGLRVRVAFLLLGIVTAVLAFVVEDNMWSTLLGVLAFSSFWSIKEVREQQTRVERGWFPANPKMQQRKSVTD